MSGDKVAVLMGGSSSEREVSFMSGKAVLAALISKGINAHAFDPSVDDLMTLKQQGFTRVVISLHGRLGEDGSVQGALDIMGLPYTGSGVMASAIAMHKGKSKLIWQAVGVPIAASMMLRNLADVDVCVTQVGLPVMVKPVHEGSTLGIRKASTRDELIDAFNYALSFDKEVMAEKFISGRELTATVIDGVAYPLVQINAPDGNYDFQNKYYTDVTEYLCPAPISAELTAKIQADTLRAFDSLGVEAWGRADLLLQDNGEYVFLEINTLPGMTSHSLVPIAAKAAGLSFADLCVKILSMATCRHNARKGSH
jgi:D-alanine-D-alanine ligase